MQGILEEKSDPDAVASYEQVLLWREKPQH